MALAPCHRIMELGPLADSTSVIQMQKTQADYRDPSVDCDLYSGMMHLHVLHHAALAPVFGLGMVEELARNGYRISPGTLYPLLHRLEKKGYLRQC